MSVHREKIERVTSCASGVEQTVKTLSQWLTEMEAKRAQIHLTHLDSYSLETYVQSLKVGNYLFWSFSGFVEPACKMLPSILQKVTQFSYCVHMSKLGC